VRVRVLPAPRSCRLVHAGALEASGNDRHIRQNRPFTAAPPPFACHRRRDGQVQEPHVAQPVEQGAQERCGLTNCSTEGLTSRAGLRRPALRSLRPPADASLPRRASQASRSRRRTSTLRPRGCVWAAEWPAGDAPAPLPPRQPATRRGNAFHAGCASRMRRHCFRLAPACPDPCSLMP